MNIEVKNRVKKVSNNQTSDEIIDYLCIAVQDSAKDFPALRKQFNSPDKLEALQSIFDYTQENFTYYKEPPSKQQVRTAGRVINDKIIDCKGFSTFIVCCCLACDIPANFKVASYNYFDHTPTHVYVVAFVNNKRVVLDGTLKKFDKEHPYKNAFEVKPKIKKSIMGLEYLQGTPSNQIYGKAERQARRDTRKDKRQERRSETKEEKKARREQRKSERGTLVAKIAAAPSRLAFTTVVKLNGFKLAEKLNSIMRKDNSKLQSFWAKFGGNFPDLQRAIESGMKKSGKGLGEPVTLATAMATATPIMIAIASVIKQLGLFENKTEETAFDEGIEDGIDILESDPNIEKQFVMTDGEEEVYAMTKDTKKRGLPPSPTRKDVDENATGEGMSNGMKIGIGVAVLGLGYMLLKK